MGEAVIARALVAFVLCAIAADAQVVLRNDERVLSPVHVERIETAQSFELASDGRDFLATWYDGRSGEFGLRAHAARIGEDGRVLDATSIPLTFGVGLPYWTGTYYTVVSIGQEYSHISRDGEILASGRFDNFDDFFPFYAKDGAGTGAKLLLARHKSGQLAVRVFDARTMLREREVLFPNVSDRTFAVVQGPDAALVLRATPQGLRAASFDRHGFLTWDQVVATPPRSIVRVIGASDGKSHYAVVYDYGGAGTFGAVIFDRDGQRIREIAQFGGDPGGFVGPWQFLVWNGSGYTLLHWSVANNRSTLHAIDIALDGTVSPRRVVLDRLTGLVSPDTRVASNAFGTTVLAYEPAGNESGRVRVAPRPSELATATDMPVVFGARPQEPPAAAGSLVAWRERVHDQRTSTGAVRATLPSITGEPLVLSETSCDETPVGASSNGASNLVAWLEPEGVRAAIVNASGDVVARVRVSNEPQCEVRAMAAVATPSMHYLFWTEYDFAAVRAVRILPDGTLLDIHPLNLGISRFSQRVLVATSDGTNAYVGWVNRVVRFAPDGSVAVVQEQLPDEFETMWWNGASLTLVTKSFQGHDYRFFAPMATPPAPVRLAAENLVASTTCARTCTLIGMTRDDDWSHVSVDETGRVTEKVLDTPPLSEPHLLVGPTVLYTRRIAAFPFGGSARLFARTLAGERRRAVGK